MVVTGLLTATLLSITPVFAKAIPAVTSKNEHFTALTASSPPLSARSQVPLGARSPQDPVNIGTGAPTTNNYVSGYPICNVTGFTTVPGDYRQWTYRNNNTSIYQCRAACKKDSECKSYSYNALYAGCWFYNKEVQYTQLNADDTSAFAHFDTVCKLPKSGAKPEGYDQWEDCMDDCVDDCADDCLEDNCDNNTDDDGCNDGCDDEEPSEDQDTCVHHDGNTDEDTDEDGWDTENDKATHTEQDCEETDNDGWDTENDQAYGEDCDDDCDHSCSCGDKKL